MNAFFISSLSFLALGPDLADAPGAGGKPPGLPEAKKEANRNEAKGKGSGGGGRRMVWLSLQDAIEILRREYRPLFIVYAPGGGEDPEKPRGKFEADVKDCLKDPGILKALESYLCVELTTSALDSPYPIPPGEAGAMDVRKEERGREAAAKEKSAGGKAGDPPEGTKKVSQKLGIVPGVPALLILDFREKAVRRYQEKLPKPGALRGELKGISGEMARLAGGAFKVEKLLERIEYTYGLGESRQAVLLILPLDDSKLQRSLDPVLSERVASLIARLRSDGARAMATGEALESERRFLEAVTAYEDAARRFPFPEILRESTHRQSIAMRKARGD